jgi:hypothetical protein
MPIPEIILSLLRPKFSDREIALWFTTPNVWLEDWQTPAQVLNHDPHKVIEAARYDGAEKIF